MDRERISKIINLHKIATDSEFEKTLKVEEKKLAEEEIAFKKAVEENKRRIAEQEIFRAKEKGKKTKFKKTKITHLIEEKGGNLDEDDLWEIAKILHDGYLGFDGEAFEVVPEKFKVDIMEKLGELVNYQRRMLL